MFMITEVVDDDALSLKVKEIIKYIDKHDGIIDKLFLDIYTDMSNLFGAVKNEENDTIYVSSGVDNFEETLSRVNECINHHIEKNIPNKYQSDIRTFLYRVIFAPESKNIQITRKR